MKLPVERLFQPAIALVIAFSLWKCLQLVWRHAHKSPLRHLRGPKATSFILGNLGDMMNDHNGELVEKWFEEYGETIKVKGFFNSNRLLTVDTCVAHHILTHNVDYQKSLSTRKGIAEIFGEGLLLVEGAQHRQQRRIMNPAFGPAQIRALTDMFLAKSCELRDLWSSEIAKDSTSAVTGARIDILPWLNRLMLDVIGLAGFNYQFNSLDPSGNPNELNEAVSTMFSAVQNFSVLGSILRAFIPILGFIPTAKRRKLQAAKHTMMQIGEVLLSNAKVAVNASETEKAATKKNSLYGRDLLSMLVKANMNTSISENQKLSDEDVIAQVPTFLLAGHETTSSAAAWALFSLAQAPEVQRKLRDELLSLDTDTPSMDELMALPYLDAVVREVLRLHAPLKSLARVAMKDDVLPVEKPYVDKYGVVRDTIPIAKGDEITVHILVMNRCIGLWGPDAHEFKPERWNEIPEAVSRIPGVWGHMLTFIGGPRACIGYRFALLEIKAMLFFLVRAFEFELAVPASEVVGRATIARRPTLRSDPTREGQLPLLIRPYQKE